MDKNIDMPVEQLFDDETIENESATSVVVDLQQTVENDYSIQYVCSGGAGTADIEVTESINGDDWELNANKVASGLRAGDTGLVKYTSGLAAAFIKVIITETVGTDPITLNVWICTR